jgi:tRNA nucleotidyltransferase/poly(A) polymerase
MGFKSFIKEQIRKVLAEERISFEISLPEDIKKIKDVFKKNGFKLYVVGGAVRDALLGIPPKDFDLATDAVPDKVEKILSQAGYRTLPTGKAFGVINVFTDNNEYEIATFRSDIGKGRRPDAVEFTNIETDTKRRDLTFNALFYDIDTQEVVDLVGGVNDLKKGIVRTVGNPSDRFDEDRLRIMRAIRFAGRFGSELDPQVDAALKKDSSLEGISAERIRDEFLKGIKSAKSVMHFLKLLDNYNLFDWIFKGLTVNKDFIEEKNPKILIAHLIKNNDEAKIQKQLNVLKYTIDEIKGVVFLLKLIKLSPQNAILLKRLEKNSSLTPQDIKTFANIEHIDSKLIDAFLRFKLTVSGEDLMKQGIKQGPELGKAINAAEYNNFLKFLR